MDLMVIDAGGEQICDLLDIDGLTLNRLNKTADITANIVRNVKNLKIREDDIILCSPPKSGEERLTQYLLFRFNTYHDDSMLQVDLHLISVCRCFIAARVNGQ